MDLDFEKLNQGQLLQLRAMVDDKIKERDNDLLHKSEYINRELKELLTPDAVKKTGLIGEFIYDDSHLKLYVEKGVVSVLLSRNDIPKEFIRLPMNKWNSLELTVDNLNYVIFKWLFQM